MAQWDVFISHASEDKEAVACPLANKLREAGLRVWLDKNELTLGDSLRRKIDQGLAESRFGVVILSEAFLAKEWPQLELDACHPRIKSFCRFCTGLTNSSFRITRLYWQVNWR